MAQLSLEILEKQMEAQFEREWKTFRQQKWNPFIELDKE